jgi:diaminohydroxyphosphoribosylaminopyrimidine deaminase/5-amino-6-(5-phosphoribosylamino)uracil reductase
MRRALHLARLGTGRTGPNPMVGAVVVRDGAVVGSGYHVYAQILHAERMALDAAGAAARGADLYVTLEPCCHHGRTPPCADAILAAGVRRVFCGMVDPNPLVAGGGIERLRCAGIDVIMAGDPAPFQSLNRGFISRIARRRPWVTLKAAATLDGRMAPLSGRSRWISGERSRRHAHWLRFRHDASLAGIGTVLADDPLLTCRHKRVREQPPLRLVLDPSLRLPPESRLATTAAEAPVWIFCRPGASPPARAALETRGVKVVPVPVADDGGLDLAAALGHLADAGVSSVLVEGGGRTLAGFIRAGLADEFNFYFAPMLLGERARPMAGDLGVLELDGCPRLDIHRVRPLPPDWLFEGFFCGGVSAAPPRPTAR